MRRDCPVCGGPCQEVLERSRPGFWRLLLLYVLAGPFASLERWQSRRAHERERRP